MFVDQLRNCGAMKTVLMYYDTTPAGHVAKTYEWLSGQVLLHLENKRLAENRLKIQAHLKQP
eukprot:12925870-Prorocentrum_lima.AAC.1